MTNIDPRFAVAHYEHDLDVSKAADALIAKTANQIRTDEAVLGMPKQVDTMLDEMMTNARLHLGGEFKTGFVSAIQDLRSRLAKEPAAAPVAHSDAQVVQVPIGWLYRHESCAPDKSLFASTDPTGWLRGQGSFIITPVYAQPTAAIDVRDAALEAAAQRCDTHANYHRQFKHNITEVATAEYLAGQLRALKSAPSAAKEKE